MEERTFFDRFHEALDIEPRPGAYERLRTELTRKPVALKRRPAFRMRFTKMTLRLTAAVAAVLIAIALIATFVAVHNHPVGVVPATDANVKTFRALIVADYNAMNASTSNHCGTIDDAGCAAALVPVIAALQKWADDINAYPNTPAQYKLLASALRVHVLSVIKDSNAAIAYQKAGDAADFDFAMRGTFYQRAWVDPASFAIEGTYQGGAPTYSQAVAAAKRAIQGCMSSTPGPYVLGCNHLQQYEPCDGAQKQVCEADLENTETLIEQSLVDTALNPSSKTSYLQLQQDLGSADAGLLAIREVLVNRGDSGDLNIAQTAFSKAMNAAEFDVATL